MHLLYDFICDPNIMIKLLQNYSHLALRKNLFSIKNFIEIKDGTLQKFLEDVYKKALKHVQNCEVIFFNKILYKFVKSFALCINL